MIAICHPGKLCRAKSLIWWEVCLGLSSFFDGEKGKNISLSRNEVLVDSVLKKKKIWGFYIFSPQLARREKFQARSRASIRTAEGRVEAVARQRRKTVPGQGGPGLGVSAAHFVTKERDTATLQLGWGIHLHSLSFVLLKPGLVEYVSIIWHWKVFTKSLAGQSFSMQRKTQKVYLMKVYGLDYWIQSTDQSNGILYVVFSSWLIDGGILQGTKIRAVCNSLKMVCLKLLRQELSIKGATEACYLLVLLKSISKLHACSVLCLQHSLLLQK